MHSTQAIGWLLRLWTLAALGLIVGCRPSIQQEVSSNSSSQLRTPVTLVYGRGEDANTLDPIHTDIGEAIKVIHSVYDTLVGYRDDSLELQPALAMSWQHSEDGLRWVFQLREGVKFHDGQPLNAEAVVFSFERLIQETHPGLYDPARPYRPSYSMIDAVSATGPLEVTFRLKAPSAIFLKNVAMFPASIVSPNGVIQYGKGFADHPIGTGPFRFARWIRDQQIVLEAFDDHWRGRPKLDRVIFVPISESASRVLQLTRGEVHIADDLPPSDLASLAQTPGLTIQHQTGLNIAYLAMQTEKPPLNIPLVRQAIWHAIDKQELIRVAYAGRAQAAVTVVPPAMWGHHGQLQDRKFDVQQAKELMNQAQTSHNLQMPINLSLSVMSQSRPYMQQPLRLASFIKDSLAPIGIEVRIESRPVNQHFERLSAGQFDLGLSGWSSDNSDPDNFLYPLFDSDNISDHGNNLSRYRNPELQRLLVIGQQEMNETTRRELYLRAQEIVLQEAPIVPLVHVQLNIGHRSSVRGYYLHPSALVNLRSAFFELQP